MNDQPTPKRRNGDEVLDQLLDALLDRYAERRQQRVAVSVEPEAATAVAESAGRAPETTSQPKAADPQEASREPQPGDADWTPPPSVPSIGLSRLLTRVLLAIALVTIVINIPITRYGVSLARILPDERQLVIRDGLLVKGSGPEVYRLEDDKLRWISSLDAFHHLGLVWDDVHQVDDSFIAEFEQGAPIHVLLKCFDSPHIYRLEGAAKRWIKDIATFEAEGHVWDDVSMVDCAYLDSLPLGPPIPPDAGSPPGTN